MSKIIVLGNPWLPCLALAACGYIVPTVIAAIAAVIADVGLILLLTADAGEEVQ
jgi:hypothetical protein